LVGVKTKHVLLAIFLAFATPLCDAFPDKPVRFIIGFTPGGPSDILARAVGQKLAERWGQQVVIENRPGAGGNLAAEAVAKSAPDGHTWLLGNNSILATNQSLYRKLPYDPVKDFAPVALVAVQPNILVVHPALSPPATCWPGIHQRDTSSGRAGLRMS
jgi:tripartite-type tricarboxylate transporter receptor subunit TctC